MEDKDKNKKSESQEMMEYQDDPRYTGYEDYTPVGRKALKAYNKTANAPENSKEKYNKVHNVFGEMATSPSGRKAAQEVIAKDRQQTKSFENSNPMGDTYKKGGKVRSSASKRGDGIATKGHTRGKYL